MRLEDFVFEHIILISFLLVTVIVTPLVLLNGIGASSGQHSGYVTAVEFNDNALWDANIVYFKSSTESTQEDSYCVNDPNLKSQLEFYSQMNQKIVIEYSNPFWFWTSLCNGGQSIITDVKVIDNGR